MIITTVVYHSALTEAHVIHHNIIPSIYIYIYTYLYSFIIPKLSSPDVSSLLIIDGLLTHCPICTPLLQLPGYGESKIFGKAMI